MSTRFLMAVAMVMAFGFFPVAAQPKLPQAKLVAGTPIRSPIS